MTKRSSKRCDLLGLDLALLTELVRNVLRNKFFEWCLHEKANSTRSLVPANSETYSFSRNGTDPISRKRRNRQNCSVALDWFLEARSVGGEAAEAAGGDKEA